MRTIHPLKNHSCKDLAEAVCTFLSNNDMDSTVTCNDDGSFSVNGENKAGLLDKAFGSDMRCNATLTEDHRGNVVCDIGGGAYADKAVSGALLGSSLFTVPVTGPIIPLGILCWTLMLGGNTANQVSLPKKVDDFIAEYLAG